MPGALALGSECSILAMQLGVAMSGNCDGSNKVEMGYAEKSPVL